MLISKFIKLIIVGIVLILGYKFLVQLDFFKTETVVTGTQDTINSTLKNNQNILQNANISHQIERAKLATGQPAIVGCMKTTTSCSCIDQRGKRVATSQAVCLQNVKDSSGNQHKLMRNN